MDTPIARRVEVVAGPYKGKRGRSLGVIQSCEQKPYALVIIDGDIASREIPAEHVKEAQQ